MTHLAVKSIFAPAFVAGVLLVEVVYRRSQIPRRRIWSLRISPTQLQSMMRDERTPLIIDLRTPLDMLSDPRMIPGAIRLTQEELSAASFALPKDDDIVVYCTCPGQRTSIDTALALRKAGLAHVRLLSGGFQEWKRLGYELEDPSEKVHWQGQIQP